MTDAAPVETPPKTTKRSALLSDDAWAALKEAGALEERSASELCQHLLAHYLSLEKRPVYALPEELETRPRSIYFQLVTWGAAKAEAVHQRRSVSAMLEQLIRSYVGLELGPRMT